MPTDGVTERPLRADAERNRRRILAAAATLFAEHGLDVSLDDVAAAAGVGVGTVYRRFPDKDALIDELFAEKVADMRRLALDALEIEDPWTAFATFVLETSRLQAENRGLKEALLSDCRGRDRVRRARDTIAPCAGRLLERAQAAGVVRADLAVTDLPMIHTAVGLIADRTRDVAPAYWERLVTLMLDGLRPERSATTPMPTGPLDPEQFAAVLAPRRRC